MSTIHFDRNRMQHALYDNLNSTRGCAAFTGLVLDFMEHLRLNNSDPSYQCSQDDLALATVFLSMVNTDHAWPLVQQVVPEFKSPKIDLSSCHNPLRYILEKIQPRLPILRQTPRASRLLQLQENLLWLKMKALIERLAYGSAGKDQAAPERRIEVGETMSLLAHMHDVSLCEQLTAAHSTVKELERKLKVEEQKVATLNREIESLIESLK